MKNHRYHVSDRVIIIGNNFQCSDIPIHSRGTVIAHGEGVNGVFQEIKLDGGVRMSIYNRDLDLVKCNYERNKSRKKNKNK